MKKKHLLFIALAINILYFVFFDIIGRKEYAIIGYLAGYFGGYTSIAFVPLSYIIAVVAYFTDKEIKSLNLLLLYLMRILLFIMLVLNVFFVKWVFIDFR